MSGKTIIAFVLGAVAGAAGTWYYLNKKHYNEPDVNDEFDEDEVPSDEDDHSPDDDFDKAAKTEYDKITKQYNAAEEDKTPPKKPYVITREEFCDGTMPTNCTYSYFEDGVFTDEYNNIVEDAEETLGPNIAELFEDNEDDLLYIRNEGLFCDYEILREGITYHESPDKEE